ncbi:hypothetical protein B0H16DRAFT_1503042 [Mycena metata]|uniref:Uncharacterized protein n=1 Tax=Mycena metata TaxID=1033252 RepID=A0AAD7NWP5_9AGAR|nr:hypothetical protein B0H16DRAFT_1503042 [Mycena metata]
MAEEVPTEWSPLGFRARCPPLSFTTLCTYRAQVVKELSRHSERWGAVELLIPRQGHYLFDEVRGRLPCLTKLCLNLKSESELVIESFAEAPRLEQLYLISGLYSVTFVLPWHQLTTLTCENFTNVECMEILQLCEALVDCSLIGKPTRISMGLNLSTPIARQHLTSLRAEGMVTQRILQNLELPSLRDLQWEVDYFGHSLEILLSFLARSHCRLRNICLWLIKGKDLIQRFTPFFTSLVVLEIKTFEEFLNDEFLRWFTHDLEALPNLRKIAMDLDLQDWRAQNWTVELMREMIQSRCPGFTASRSVCLDTFRLVYRPDKDEDDTGLLHLAAEFKPLLDPKMIEFTISPNSKNWNLDLDSDSDFSSDLYWSD